MTGLELIFWTNVEDRDILTLEALQKRQGVDRLQLVAIAEEGMHDLVDEIALRLALALREQVEEFEPVPIRQRLADPGELRINALLKRVMTPGGNTPIQVVS